MSNNHNSCKSTIFIFGATILGLIFILATTAFPTTTSPFLLYSTVAVFAAEDEEEEEEESSKDEDKEEEEEKESSDKEEEAKDGGEEEEESSNNNNKEEEEETTISPPPPSSEPIVNLTGDQILNPQPVVTDIEPAQPVINNNKEFNATCKCMTATSAAEEGVPTTTATQPEQQQPIPVTSADIQDSKSFGEVTDPKYTNYYTVSNLLDTIINDKSFWSQAGKSSFYIKLDGTLDQYQVCSMELNVYQPKSTPFLLDIGVSQNYSGILDQPNKRVVFDKCVKNMDEILMMFDAPSNSFISLGEIKLFGSKLGIKEEPEATLPTIIPSQQPILNQQPTTTSTTTTTENATKINIKDSIAEIDIQDSTITFKFDPLTATFIGTGNK